MTNGRTAISYSINPNIRTLMPRQCASVASQGGNSMARNVGQDHRTRRPPMARLGLSRPQPRSEEAQLPQPNHPRLDVREAQAYLTGFADTSLQDPEKATGV